LTLRAVYPAKGTIFSVGQAFGVFSSDVSAVFIGFAGIAEVEVFRFTNVCGIGACDGHLATRPCGRTVFQAGVCTNFSYGCLNTEAAVAFDILVTRPSKISLFGVLRETPWVLTFTCVILSLPIAHRISIGWPRVRRIAIIGDGKWRCARVFEDPLLLAKRRCGGFNIHCVRGAGVFRTTWP